MKADHRTVSLRIPEDLHSQLWNLANAPQTPYGSFNQWIAEYALPRFALMETARREHQRRRAWERSSPRVKEELRQIEIEEDRAHAEALAAIEIQGRFTRGEEISEGERELCEWVLGPLRPRKKQAD